MIVSLSEMLGAPSSVTVTVAENVPGPCTSVGVQLNAPVLGLIDIPAAMAAASRLKVRVFAGMSASVAVAVNVNVKSSSRF